MLVRSKILEYCSPVWTPHQRYLIDKVEHVQRYFTKRIRGMWNIPYDQRMDLLNLKSLEYRRVVNDLTMCYRILHGYIDTSMSMFFTVNTAARTRGHDQRLYLLSFSKDIGKFLFTNRVIKMWNDLPADVVHAPSLPSFKKRLLDRISF